MDFTLANVRLKLYDSVASNVIISSQEFSDTTITNAMEQALSYWNSTAPLITDLEYSLTTDVPEKYSEPFFKGTVGILITDVVLKLSRNREPNAADGTLDKAIQEYKQIGDQYIDFFVKWIEPTKRTLTVFNILTGDPTQPTSCLKLTQDTAETLTISITDTTGSLVTFTGYTVKLVAKEHRQAAQYAIDETLTITSPTVATLTLATTDVVDPGLMLGEIILLIGTTVKKRYPLYVNIESSLTEAASREILTVDRLRTYLRDKAGENYLVGDTEFSDSDLARAIFEPVWFWNGAQPVINYNYTTMSFPEMYIHMWEKGAAGYALRSFATKLIAGALGPTKSDIQNTSEKGEKYLQISEALIAEYKEWVRETKYGININNFYGSTLDSNFGYAGYSRRRSDWY